MAPSLKTAQVNLKVMAIHAGSLVFSVVQNYCIISYLCQQIDVAIS
jgi:hypothetical protein